MSGPRVYYFGAWSRSRIGHFWYAPGGRSLDHTLRNESPFDQPIDGVFAPRIPTQPEGLASLVWRFGWTFVSFWDRSADSRGNSNSVFAIEGEHGQAESLSLSRAVFPEVFARLGFDVHFGSAGLQGPGPCPSGGSS